MTCAVAVDRSGPRRESVPPVLKRSASACLAGRHVDATSFHGISANIIPADTWSTCCRAGPCRPSLGEGFLAMWKAGEEKTDPLYRRGPSHLRRPPTLNNISTLDPRGISTASHGATYAGLCTISAYSRPPQACCSPQSLRWSRWSLRRRFRQSCRER